MRLLFTLTFFSLLLASCKKVDLPDGTPNCIKGEIRNILKQEVWNPPARVWEYTMDGNKVYLFSANCCDQASTVFDDKCNLICVTGGGWGGGNCPSSWHSATGQILIWEDQR